MKIWGRLLTAAACLLALAGPAVIPAAGEESARLPDEVLMQYYDNTLFVGDSVMRLFGNYVKDRRTDNPAFFPGIKFYSAYNYQMVNMTRENIAGGDAVELTYKGSRATLREIMQKENRDKVFIMIGLNDRIYAHLDRAERYIDRLTGLRDKYAPGVRIGFFSLTPVTRNVGEKNRDLISAYNTWLEEKCAATGALYIDVASRIRDGEGWLPGSLSRDHEYHLNDEGNALWAEAMLDFAQAQYEAGLWAPEENAD